MGVAQGERCPDGSVLRQKLFSWYCPGGSRSFTASVIVSNIIHYFIK